MIKKVAAVAATAATTGCLVLAPGGEAGVAADLLEQAAQAASARERDDRMLAQVGDGDRLAPAERMIASCSCTVPVDLEVRLR